MLTLQQLINIIIYFFHLVIGCKLGNQRCDREDCEGSTNNCWKLTGEINIVVEQKRGSSVCSVHSPQDLHNVLYSNGVEY